MVALPPKTIFSHDIAQMSHIMRKPVLPYANNKGADPPEHLRSLISTFVVRYLYSVIPTDSISRSSRFFLVSVAEQDGLCLTWSQSQRQVFS